MIHFQLATPLKSSPLVVPSFEFEAERYKSRFWAVVNFDFLKNLFAALIAGQE